MRRLHQTPLACNSETRGCLYIIQWHRFVLPSNTVTLTRRSRGDILCRFRRRPFSLLRLSSQKINQNASPTAARDFL